LGFGGERRGNKSLWRGKPLFESFKKIGKGFGGERRGKKGLWRCKPLFKSFKKIRKSFGGFKGFHLFNFKVPLNWGFWGLNIQIDNFILIIIQNSNYFNYNLKDKITKYNTMY